MSLVMEIDLDEKWIDKMVETLLASIENDSTANSLGFVDGIERSGEVLVLECDTDFFYFDEDGKDEDGSYPYVEDEYMLPIAKVELAVLTILMKQLPARSVGPAVYNDIFLATRDNKPALLDGEDASVILRTALWGAPHGVDY